MSGNDQQTTEDRNSHNPSVRSSQYSGTSTDKFKVDSDTVWRVPSTESQAAMDAAGKSSQERRKKAPSAEDQAAVEAAGKSSKERRNKASKK